MVFHAACLDCLSIVTFDLEFNYAAMSSPLAGIVHAIYLGIGVGALSSYPNSHEQHLHACKFANIELNHPAWFLA